ncbi:Cyanovirin-N [Lentithecium fluviatile CBS 122367]|uniref:Cyanovirin-N n=1 Tax=Lentithecium fluviatile CBS 122367 TaxID=1168545 RepID=A0A6G1JE90_9PLEO|nr:Cyanovirin-N [Lentithecium fluviatile CBS 122367]
MMRTVLLASFAYFSASNAAPSVAPRATAPGSISEQCTNVQINQGWLVGDCLTGDNDTRISSGTFLNNKISNEDGILTWKLDGHYGYYCYNCEIVNGGSLHCQCQPNFGQRKDTTLKLDEHIGVYSGHLLSNLKSAPIVPSSPSKYAFPDDKTYGIGGNATCPGVRGDNWCSSVAHRCSNTASTDFSEAVINNVAPISECYNPNVYFPDHLPFEDFKAVSTGAWEVTGYSDEACTKKLVTISPEELGQCKTMKSGEFVRGVTSRPLFNGDPN